ncbi:MAG: NAD(P)H-hydrate dehydratase [Myxococcales bacterium]|nr:NAD(P)H-hydrate dehydratase [Myxococcales bacterium]
MDRALLAERGWPCPTADQMRRIDAHAIRECGLPGRLLMESAGRAVAVAVRLRFPEVRRPLVVCGGGNNGGDGYVVARTLRDWDARVAPIVVTLAEPGRHSEEARANLALLERAGIEVVSRPTPDRLRELRSASDLVIDAILGVGLTRRVEGELAQALEALRGGPPIVAVDLPSGLSSDTGEPLGAWLPPDLVVTLGFPKLGLALAPLEAEVLVADLGFPRASLEASGVRQFLLDEAAAGRLLPARPLAGHKGSFGHVLVVAGSTGKTGAACLAAAGALRAGAGLVTVAAPRELHAVYEEKLTEAMTLPVEDTGTGAFASIAAKTLLREAESREALVVGPGLGIHPETVSAVQELLDGLRLPCVVDADALNAFARTPEGLRGAGPRVLTPHPGEMARLLGCQTREVGRDRVAAARELASRTGAVVVLKGARSLVVGPDGELSVNPTGGPALATGGTGDVLAGVIGALLASGTAPFEAAAVGVYLHGMCGSQPFASAAGVGSMAGEIADRIPAAWQALAGSESRAEEPHGDLLRRFP